MWPFSMKYYMLYREHSCPFVLFGRTLEALDMALVRLDSRSMGRKRTAFLGTAFFGQRPGSQRKGFPGRCLG